MNSFVNVFRSLYDAFIPYLNWLIIEASKLLPNYWLLRAVPLKDIVSQSTQTVRAKRKWKHYGPDEQIITFHCIPVTQEESEKIKKRLLKHLKLLKNSDCTNVINGKSSNDRAEKVLKSLYLAGRKRVVFTEAEQKEIGNLVVEGITLIKQNIVETFYFIRKRLETAVLSKRSAIQFLIEDFGDFPARNSTLKEELMKVNIQESIVILNEIITYFHDISDTDDFPTDPEEVGSLEVPDTHTWWSI